MKKLFLIVMLLLFAIGNTWAQNPNNHWQLGNTDVNFSTNPPTISTAGNVNQYGNASISDDNGNLLFYTDGQTVWNKNHQVMTGYYLGVLGSIYTDDVNKQPAVIVPYPGNSNKFYIFTATSEYTLGSSQFNRYKYGIVEFDSQNPLGILLGGNYLHDGPLGFGPLTVVKNSTNDGYFVITKSDGGYFISYKITNQGLDTNPVVSSFLDSTIGYQPNSQQNGSAYSRTSSVIKLNPLNSKIGELFIQTKKLQPFQNNPFTYSSKFHTFDFNNTTGEFSNYQLIENNATFAYSDFEFSNNSSNVYLLGNNVFVKDLSNLSQAPRKLTTTGLSSFPNGFLNIQRDKYNNLWLKSNSFLNKLENQDSFLNSTITLNTLPINISAYQFTNFTLPQLVQTFAPPCPSSLTVSTNVTSGIDQKQASNSITATNTIGSGASAIYHAATVVVLKPSFTAVNGSKFRAYIEGCTGVFVARQSQSNAINTINDAETTQQNKAQVLQIVPNPNNGIFKIALTGVEVGNIVITDMYGLTVYKSDFKNQTDFEVNIQDSPKGIYIVRVTTGEMVHASKIIKN
jgi:hypothetical protein